jgi:glycosyltransferase involved in cell wall biosynthesis
MSIPDADRAVSSVSCVIPAYNEQSRIGRVLSAVVGHPLVSEILVVDDGSTDDTATIVAGTEGVRLIEHRRNGGKCRALRTGIEAAAGPLILLLDADLVGLTARHVTSLIRPVILDRADISISLRENAPTAWHLIGLDYISGERVFHKRLLHGRYDEMEALPPFGFEVFLNDLCIERRARVAVVDWKEVESPLKYRKYGLLGGVRGDARMMVDVMTAVPPLHLARQIPALRRLRVAPPGEVGETDFALSSGER